MLKDGLGSTIALANKGGNAVGRMNYDAFGNLRFPDKPGHGVAPCREFDLDDILDRLDGGRSFGFDHDGWWYGRHWGKALTPYLYTGRRLDTFSGNYFNRNRYYSPKVGRFVSSDPIGFSGDSNLYRYAANNPLRFTDPTGKNPLAVLIGLKFGIAAVDFFFWFDHVNYSSNQLCPGNSKVWQFPSAWVIVGQNYHLLQYKPKPEEIEFLRAEASILSFTFYSDEMDTFYKILGPSEPANLPIGWY